MRDRILEYIKKKGPVVPIDVAQELRIDSVIASAFLSECLSSKALLLSHLKVGTSKVYYLPEQREMLEQFTSGLHPREKEAYEILKQKRVLRESTLPPPTRVAIRDIKDFAVPLEVTFPDRKEIFWRWYQVSNEEASAIIKTLMVVAKPAPQAAPVRVPPIAATPAPQVEQTPIRKPVAPPVKQEEAAVALVQTPVVEPIKENPIPAPVKEVTKPTPVPTPVQTPAVEPIKENPIPAPVKEAAKPTKIAAPKKAQQTLANEEVLIDDPFVDEVKEYFVKENIEVRKTELIKTKTEAYFTIALPTPFGDMEFFVNAKNKKRLNEADLMGAYAQGSIKKLPAILLAKGELTKKAQEQLDKELKGLIFSKF